MLAELTPLSIALLERSRLKEAVELVNELFPDEGEKPAEGLRAIFEPHLHPMDFSYGICDRICWTASELASHGVESSILGVVGLYRVLGDPAALYLGWFGVARAARGKGVGGQLLTHAIAEAKRSGVQYLRLDTTDAPYFAAANRLYERHGLAVSKRDDGSPQGSWSTVWRELSLTS